MLCIRVRVLRVLRISESLHAVAVRGPLVDGVAVHSLQAVFLPVLFFELSDVAVDDNTHVCRKLRNSIRNFSTEKKEQTIRTKMNDPVEDDPPNGNETDFVDVLAFVSNVLVCGSVDAGVDEFRLAHREHQHAVSYAGEN